MGDIKYTLGNAYPYGSYKINDGIQFCISYPEDKRVSLRIYKNNEEIDKIDLKDYKVLGNVHSVVAHINDIKNISYDYEINNKLYLDPYTKSIKSTRKYGELCDCNLNNVSTIYDSSFNWEEDTTLKIPYSDVISYMMHVRGFTKHPSSGVKAKGTFKGIKEKIPYLKELGINQVILMPAYGYDEIETINDYKVNLLADKSAKENTRLNYWGFKAGYYYVPKPEFAHSDNSVVEFKDLVKSLHKENIEVIMQFYFPTEINRNLILDCLEFWTTDYHIDGFMILGSNIPLDIIATNPRLIDSKIYYERYDKDGIFNNDLSCVNMNLAQFNHDFMIDLRRFLKSDEDMIHKYLQGNRANNTLIKNLNHLTSYEGFTLNDLVSYDYKHNDDNGEENKDGNPYNYSWNCGFEGATKKALVTKLRLKQLKNAFSLLLLCQGPPMILAGDELMNTQYGNNNPYCQDNETTWVKWKLNKQNSEIFSFVKELIKLRREHPIQRMPSEASLLDHKACGYPDMSYHSENAWYPKFDTHVRHIGIMLCGKYAFTNDKKEDDFFYYAINMHWEKHDFALPKLPKGLGWKVILNTEDTKNGLSLINLDDNLNEVISVTPRTIVVLTSVKNEVVSNVNDKVTKNIIENKILEKADKSVAIVEEK